MLHTARQRYRKSDKGRATARSYGARYYHAVLKHNPVEIAKRRKRNSENHYSKYGLTREQAIALKAKGCSLCGSTSGKMNIDHCHQTGKVRGSLCNPCNLMVGWLELAKPFMEKIDAYLGGSHSVE